MIDIYIYININININIYIYTHTVAILAQADRPISKRSAWDRRLFQPLSRFQDAVIQDIRDLVDDMQEETTDWFHSLPRHVQSAPTRALSYADTGPDSPSPTLELPQTETLYRELSHGFPLMGELTPGVNWHVRQDQKYLDPTPIPEFSTQNRQYIHEKLRQNRVDQHWEYMLDEIIAEVKLGRMNGPFKAPTWWPCETVCPSKRTDTSGETLPLPHDDPFIAMAFSIEQTGSDMNTKIRRGEDWRRSGHNATCTMHDQPFHHTPDHFVSLKNWLSSKGHSPKNWRSEATIMTEPTDNCPSMTHDRLMGYC